MLVVFIWNAKSGQFDLEGEASRILLDEDIEDPIEQTSNKKPPAE